MQKVRVNIANQPSKLDAALIRLNLSGMQNENDLVKFIIKKLGREQLLELMPLTLKQRFAERKSSQMKYEAL